MTPAYIDDPLYNTASRIVAVRLAYWPTRCPVVTAYNIQKMHSPPYLLRALAEGVPQ